MQTLVAVRRSLHNTAAPAVLTVLFSIVASRIVDADRLDVILRGDYRGTIDGARQHALRLLAAVARRCGPACVDVMVDGVPVFFASSAGGAM